MTAEQILVRSLQDELTYQSQRLMAQQAGHFLWFVEMNGQVAITESHRKLVRRADLVSELLELLRNAG